MLRAAFCIAVLLVAVPLPSAAASQPLLHATVSAASMTGQVAFDGTLSSFQSTGNPESTSGLGLPISSSGPPPAAARTPPAEIRITAEKLHIETDVETATGQPALATPQRHTEPIDFTAASAVTHPARAGFLFFVAPAEPTAPHLHADAIAATFSPAAMETEPDRQVPNDARPALHGVASTTVAVRDAGVRTLRLEGDFVLMLWEWDLDVSTSSTHQLVTAGYRYEATAPSWGEIDTVGTYEERQVFIYAYGAVLEATMPVGAATSIALVPTASHLDGRLVVHAPHGDLATADGARGLHEGDWIEGTFDTAFSDVSSNAFAIAASGTPTDGRIAGQAVAFPSTASPSYWPAFAIVAVLATAGAGAWEGRRRSIRASLRGIKTAMDAGRYAEVIQRATPRMLRLRRDGDAVRTQATVSMLVLGRTDDAAKTLAGWRRGNAATRDYLWACVHAARGEAETAAARVQACMEKDPALARQLLGDPLMSTVAQRKVAAAAPAPARESPRDEGYT